MMNIKDKNGYYTINLCDTVFSHIHWSTKCYEIYILLFLLLEWINSPFDALEDIDISSFGIVLLSFTDNKSPAVVDGRGGSTTTFVSPTNGGGASTTDEVKKLRESETKRRKARPSNRKEMKNFRMMWWRLGKDGGFKSNTLDVSFFTIVNGGGVTFAQKNKTLLPFNVFIRNLSDWFFFSFFFLQLPSKVFLLQGRVSLCVCVLDLGTEIAGGLLVCVFLICGV